MVRRELVYWWLVLVAVWLCTAASLSLPEAVAAAVAALPCALLAAASRRALRGVPRPRLRWWRWFTRVPQTAVAETVAALRTSGPGRTEELALPRDRLAARQAVATVAIGLSPGTIVADVPERDAAVLVHRLVPGRSRILDRVRR
ncbi:hypothetical protein [Amycolatopsis benzoatilytica]|uniref:hypothetical protein n=1 Tax=Amycolatopsis benzoatilytica TaxID=346045 RepID=UPI0012B6803C|nr:hypothetical protein [Amycolatopsis benzoatilytica]